MTEPNYLAQTAEYQRPVDAKEWVEQRIAEMKDAGIRLARQSWDPKAKILLIEGWKDRFADQGVPNFQYAA